MQLQQQSLVAILQAMGSLYLVVVLFLIRVPSSVVSFLARAAEQYNMHLTYTLAKRSG